jgi:hypothetical protein
MVTIIWPILNNTHEESCFNNWYNDLRKREFKYARFTSGFEDECKRIISEDIGKAGATIQYISSTNEITFENEADYTFFLLRWS